MQVNGIQSTSQTTANQATGGWTTSSDMFLQLLTTQLKAQDPMSPMDPNEFVGQLVQLSTLEEVMEIRGVLQDMQQLATPAAAGEGGK